VTAAETIVRRLTAKKYPNAGRYLFELNELVQIVEAIQRDARTAMETIHLTKPEIEVANKAVEEYIERLRMNLTHVATLDEHEWQATNLRIAESVLSKLVY